MNEHVSFERFLVDQFTSADRVAPPSDSVDDILTQARRMRPLPRWLALIKEPPMRHSSRIAVGSPMVRFASLLVLSLLLTVLVVGGVVAGASLLPSPAPVTGCGEAFCPSGPLTTTRGFHAAARLLDGRVLVTGGGSRPDDSERVDLATAEVWDPKTEVSRATGPLREPRAFHSVTSLPDGRALVVGSLDNHDGTAHASAEVWDPATGAFTATGSLATGRGLHSAVLLPDGQVLIVAGVTSGYQMVPGAELWDPESGLFGAAGSLVDPRFFQTATLLTDGRVLVVGGGFDTTELWDPVSMTFSPGPSLTEARGEHSATALPDGRVLVIGGRGTGGYLASAEIWDPATQAFSSTGSLKQARAAHKATLLDDGRVVVIGGEKDHPERALASAEIWDPVTGSFSPAGSLVEGRFAHTATGLEDGRVLVSGGWLNGIPAVFTASTELWDPAALVLEPARPTPDTPIGSHEASP